jgi:hypothetical protein
MNGRTFRIVSGRRVPSAATASIVLSAANLFGREAHATDHDLALQAVRLDDAPDLDARGRSTAS